MLTALLLLAAPALADAPDDWKFSLDGYYRIRKYSFPSLYEGQSVPGSYTDQRLRLQPSLNMNDQAKFFMMADMLDTTVWGDNASLASTALFAGDPSSTHSSGTYEVPPVQVKRAWMEFKVPVGLIRVGRQPSNWGMGLLANGGDGFDDTFGENKYGATYDRFIFATRPISVAAGIADKKDPNIPLIVAVGVDRLVEDPEIQYYGYMCDPDTEEDDPRCTPDEDHSFSEDRDAATRSGAWWVDPRDDVYEMVYVVSYRGDGTQLPNGKTADLVGGVYAVNRKQAETDSNIWIVDGHLKARYEGIYVEGEALHIGGESSAITLAGVADLTSDNPLYKKVDIWGMVGRAGWEQPKYAIVMEGGKASGDATPGDEDFTGRAIHPDYNVGLILYEEVLSRVTEDAWGTGAQGLWSNGGVYNSRYIFPTVTVSPVKDLQVIGGFLMAWPDQPDGSRILCTEDEDCAQALATEDYIGWETDLAVKYRYHTHLLFSLEGGYAHATDRLPLQNTGLEYELDDDGNVYGNYSTIQGRVAYEF